MESFNLEEASIVRGMIHAAAKQQAIPHEHVWHMAWCPGTATEHDLQAAVDTLLRKGVLGEREGRVWVVSRGVRSVHEVSVTGASTNDAILLHIRGLAEQDSLVTRKWRLAKAFADYAAWVPGVRAVAVCNTLAWGAVSEESDIDIAIIARNGMVWITRLLTTLPLMLLRLRPGEAKRDPLCLSFFVSDSRLSLQSLMRKEGDVHFPYWVASMIPLVDDGVWIDFVKENAWIKTMLPHFVPVERMQKLGRPRKPGFFARWLWGAVQMLRLWMWIEWWAMEAQKKHFPMEIQERAKAGGTEVVLAPDLIKLHTHDDRAAIHRYWEEQCHTFGV